mgnify:CR=1 FL=1
MTPSGAPQRPRPTVGDASSARERREDPRGWAMGEQVTEALGRVIAGRRDIRRYRPDAIEPELLERVLEAAEMIVAKEAAMAKAILSGTPIGEVMGGNYEHMLENI